MPAGLFASLRGYRIGWLPRDLVAGLMLAAIAIPGQLATARLAGMPPATGLYAFAAGSLAFAAMGPSGPSSRPTLPRLRREPASDQRGRKFKRA
jgi:MFS superfamily sulfate permease-like transporter